MINVLRQNKTELAIISRNFVSVETVRQIFAQVSITSWKSLLGRTDGAIASLNEATRNVCMCAHAYTGCIWSKCVFLQNFLLGEYIAHPYRTSFDWAPKTSFWGKLNFASSKYLTCEILSSVKYSGILNRIWFKYTDKSIVVSIKLINSRTHNWSKF